MLKGPQQKKLHEAFIHAFPTTNALAQMLLYELDKSLEEIVEGTNLSNTVFTLIQTALSQGWLKDLVHAACKQNPGNSELQTIASDILQILNNPNSSLKSRINRIRGGVEQSDSQSTFSDTELSPFQVPLPNQKHELLLNILLDIDFEEQFELFRTVVKKHKIGGFLVHGESDCGQELLVNKLYRVTLGWRSAKLISLDFTSFGVGYKIENLWERVADCFDCQQADSDLIIQKVCESWQTQDVIFIFSKVEHMISTKTLSQWLQEFWKPLVARAAQNLRGKETETHLLMFLVNNFKQVDTASDSLFLNQYLEQDPKYPHVPLCLPPVSPFPEHTLDKWLIKANMYLEKQIPPSLTSSILFQKSNQGNPRKVCQEICKHYGLRWERELLSYLIQF